MSMEEKDVTNIANAVSNALAKLNVDTAKENGEVRKEKGEEKPEEIFSCPDCGAKITAGISFCQVCGCPLEWED
jgi:hypothetical protein